MRAEYIKMHIDRANEVAMAVKPTGSTSPVSSFGLVFMPTDRTPARCSSFGASEAHNMGLFCFMGEIVDVFAVFPQGHALIVVSAIIPIAHPMRIANLLKGDSSRGLRAKFPHLKKLCGKEHLWTQSYYVGTAGHLSAETIKRYIEESQRT